MAQAISVISSVGNGASSEAKKRLAISLGNSGVAWRSAALFGSYGINAREHNQAPIAL